MRQQIAKATSSLTAPVDIFGDPFCDDNSDDVAVARESTDAVVQALITNTKPSITNTEPTLTLKPSALMALTTLKPPPKPTPKPTSTPASSKPTAKSHKEATFDCFDVDDKGDAIDVFGIPWNKATCRDGLWHLAKKCDIKSAGVMKRVDAIDALCKAHGVQNFHNDGEPTENVHGKTRHCPSRPLNVLSSDEFSDDFRRLGDVTTAGQLTDNDAKSKVFWASKKLLEIKITTAECHVLRTTKSSKEMLMLVCLKFNSTIWRSFQKSAMMLKNAGKKQWESRQDQERLTMTSTISMEDVRMHVVSVSGWKSSLRSQIP